MKRKLLSIAFLSLGCFVYAQNWTRVHAEPDTLRSYDYDNMGDTILSRQRNEDISFYYNLISLDGGNNFSYTATDIDPTFNPSRYAKMPINKILIGYKNAPSLGSYLFNGGTDWQTIFTNVEGIGYYFETGLGQMFYTVGGPVYSLDLANPSMTNVVHNFTSSFDLRCYMNDGSKTIFGLSNGKIAFISNGDFSTYQEATVNFSQSNIGIKNIWKGGSALYATIETFYHVLLKSTDGGLTWNEVVTNSPAGTLNENKFINGTSDGRIYYYSDKASDDFLFVSTDGGQNATQVDLPTGIDTVWAGYNLGKILVSNNKVWLNIVSYNATDFSKPHPQLSGLWQLDGGTSGISEQEKFEVNVYPNPFTDQLIINNANNCTVVIRTMEGKEVLSTFSSDNDFSINTASFATGVYMVIVDSGKGQKTKLISKL